MYAYIKGILSELHPTHVVLETAGIGYEIQTPNSYRFQKYLEQEVIIHTSLIVRRCTIIVWIYESRRKGYVLKSNQSNRYWT